MKIIAIYSEQFNWSALRSTKAKRMDCHYITEYRKYFVLFSLFTRKRLQSTNGNLSLFNLFLSITIWRHFFIALNMNHWCIERTHFCYCRFTQVTEKYRFIRKWKMLENIFGLGSFAKFRKHLVQTIAWKWEAFYAHLYYSAAI